MNENFKHDYFENIDTERKAYLYGFLCADGYNCETKGQIQMTLAERDVEILSLLQSELNHSGKLTRIAFPDNPEKQTLRMVSIYSKKLSQDLAKRGCKQKKSLTLEMPDIRGDLFHHFLRGYFDGDGCIFLKERDDTALVIECPVVCSNVFAERLKEILWEKLKIKTYSQKLGKNKVCTTVKISGRRKNLVFLPWLYRNATVFLKRKEALYRKFLAICAIRPMYQRQAERASTAGL